METFIVLGFCFILYEALDFFQSCYSNNNRHHHQHPQFNKTNKNPNNLETIDENSTKTSNTEVNAQFNGEFDSTTTTATTPITPNSDLVYNDSSSDSIDLNKDTIQLDDDFISNEDEFDDDDDEETIIHNPSNVYSICDRVSVHNHQQHQQLIDYPNANKNANFNDYDKLICGLNK